MTTLKDCLAAIASFAVACALCSSNPAGAAGAQPPAPARSETRETGKVLIQYLEIVTTDVDATCNALEKVHGVTFGEPDAGLGNARTAALEGGGWIGVRAPMADHDKPIVRSYTLVDDIEAAENAAEAAGAEFAMRATEIPGRGKFAIYFLGGMQFGLWER